jgi:uncharacterized membrane protein YagU involved in acid resistance
MTFELLPALVAGLAGVAVMSLAMMIAGRMGMTDMPPMPMVLGSMMTGDPKTARNYGLMLHYILMGAIVFGLGYAAVFTLLDSAAALTGLVVGLIHGVVFGAMMLPMMPKIHPRMEDVDGVPMDVSSGTVKLTAPGMFGTQWGSMTPVGVVLVHALYGVIVAIVYTALI